MLERMPQKMVSSENASEDAYRFLRGFLSRGVASEEAFGDASEDSSEDA